MTANGTEHRAVKVVSVTGLSSIMAIAMQLVAVPICLRYWGKETYGLWLAMFSVFAVVQTTGTGFVNYVGNQINLLYHKDQSALQATLSSSIVGVVLIAALQLALVVGVIAIELLPRLTGTSSVVLAQQHADLALLTLAVSWVLGGFYFGIVHRLQIPAGLMYQAGWWGLASQLGSFGALTTSAWLGFSLVEASALFALTQFVFAFASALYIRYKLPDFYPWWQGFKVASGLRDLARSVPLIISGLIQQASSSGLVVMVSAVAGAAAVPSFTTVRTLANLWTNLTNVLTTPLLPDVVRFHAKCEWRKLLSVQEAHWVLVGTAVNASLLLVYPVIEPLYTGWTRGAVALNKGLLCALLASISLMTFGAMMNTYLTGINHRRAILFTSVARGVLGLGVGGVLMAYINLAGLGVGILVGELATLLIIVHFFGGTVPKDPKTYPQPLSFGPALLSVASVQVYLGMAGFGVPGAEFTYPIAVGGVMGAAVWGWRRLDDEVRRRLVRLAIGRLRMRRPA